VLTYTAFITRGFLGKDYRGVRLSISLCINELD